MKFIWIFRDSLPEIFDSKAKKLMVYNMLVGHNKRKLIVFVFLVFCLSQPFFLQAQNNPYQETNKSISGTFGQYDYSKTLVMKLGLS
ncbi:MAG: hypothetical protein KAQ62_08090, partial [Cyclobacteriaceae bacterium]|nr:hypothetical protein [Cyclobacteriaceae bacterium]